jgi:hypothetical protein
MKRLLLLLLAGCGGGPVENPAEPLFDGENLGSWRSVPFGGEGTVRARDGELRLDAGQTLTGVAWGGDRPPGLDYELELEAKKIEGRDIFCGIVFPHGDRHCSFVVGGWGGSVVGLSCVDDRFADDNATTRREHFEERRWYPVRLRVTRDRVEAWVGREKFVDLASPGGRLSLHPAVESARPLGIFTYQTAAAFRSIRLRRLAP